MFQDLSSSRLEGSEVTRLRLLNTLGTRCFFRAGVMLGSDNDLRTCLVSGLVELVGISIKKRLSSSLEVCCGFESFGRLRLGRAVVSRIPPN